jgi:hypothetical protein
MNEVEMKGAEKKMVLGVMKFEFQIIQTLSFLFPTPHVLFF